MSIRQQETIKDLRQQLALAKKQIRKPEQITKVVSVDVDKYCRMWAETNRWVIPAELRLPLKNDPKSFTSGAWAVLDAMRKDELLPDNLIQQHWMNRESEES